MKTDMKIPKEIRLPSDVELILESSDKKIYKTDERRIGFQQGAKWVRSMGINFTKSHFDQAIKELEKEKLDLKDFKDVESEEYIEIIGWNKMVDKSIQLLKDYKPKIK